MFDAVESAGGDKRLHERLRKSYRVTYRRMEDLASPSPPQEGVIIDVSGGGFCFLAGEPFEENSQLALLVEFPGWVADSRGDWVATNDENDVAELEVLVEVLRYEASRTVPGRFEIGVRLCGRIG
ncbi:MAG: PilZ domain-containing protein [Desulfobulbaceae bacterium]|nr:PilZ domain-containing protein [Desulfobulbaceae bacterium]